MVPALATLDGKKFGYGYEPSVDIPPTTEDTSCDEIAAFGKDNDGKETVRGVSTLVPQSFSLGIIGVAGETITFKYYRASEDREYYVEFQYIMEAGGQIGGGFGGGGFTLVLLRDPPCIPCATCTQFKASFNGDTETPLPAGQKCAPKAGRCAVTIANVFTEECLNNDLVSCFESCGAPVSPSPSPPVDVVSPSPSSPPVVVVSPSPSPPVVVVSPSPSPPVVAASPSPSPPVVVASPPPPTESGSGDQG